MLNLQTCPEQKNKGNRGNSLVLTYVQITPLCAAFHTSPKQISSHHLLRFPAIHLRERWAPVWERIRATSTFTSLVYLKPTVLCLLVVPVWACCVVTHPPGQARARSERISMGENGACLAPGGNGQRQVAGTRWLGIYNYNSLVWKEEAVGWNPASTFVPYLCVCMFRQRGSFSFGVTFLLSASA